MRKIRYAVACSLDGYIAGPNGEYDWIVTDPEIDFQAMFEQFDTILMGRRTFEVAGGRGSGAIKTLVFSRSLRQEDHPGVTIVSERIRETLDDLRAQPGRDIWLFGGGELFRSLLALDCVHTIELGVFPVLLGGGRPFLPAPAARCNLLLTEQRVYEKSGIVGLQYNVLHEDTRRATRRRTTGKR